jgi:hypothetical protein
VDNFAVAPSDVALVVLGAVFLVVLLARLRSRSE